MQPAIPGRGLVTTPTREIPAVLVVSDDAAVRARTRAAIADQARYVFECCLEDVATMTRSVYVHTVVFVVDREEPILIARLHEALAQSRIPTRIILATSPERAPQLLATAAGAD